MTWSTDRREPYTAEGIKRIACIRCGSRPSIHQWQICADKRRFRPVCLNCDVRLNKLVLEFFDYPDREEVLRRYVKEQT